MKLFSESCDAVIGRVLSPHGVSGHVKVFHYTDFPDRINLLTRVELLLDSERREFEIEKASVYNRFWLIKFTGINTREDAARIRDSLVVIPKQERVLLPEGSYYHDQLIGLKVYTCEGKLLGRICDLLITGGHDLFIIEREVRGEGKALIPAVREFIKKMDLQEGFIMVDLPEGLLDL